MKNYGHIISVPFVKKSKILLITACLIVLPALCRQGGYSAEDVHPRPSEVKLTAKASSQVKQGCVCSASLKSDKPAGGCGSKPSSSPTKKAVCGGSQGSARPTVSCCGGTSAQEKAGFVCPMNQLPCPMGISDDFAGGMFPHPCGIDRTVQASSQQKQGFVCPLTQLPCPWGITGDFAGDICSHSCGIHRAVQTSSQQKQGFVCPSCQPQAKPVDSCCGKMSSPQARASVCPGNRRATKQSFTCGGETSAPQSSGSMGSIAKVIPSRLSSAVAILTDEQMKLLKGGHCTCDECSYMFCGCGNADPTTCSSSCNVDPGDDCPGTGGSISCSWCPDYENSTCGGMGDYCQCDGWSCFIDNACILHCYLDTDPNHLKPCGGVLTCPCGGDNCPGPPDCAQCPDATTNPGCSPWNCSCTVGSCECLDFCSRASEDCSSEGEDTCQGGDCGTTCPKNGTCRWCSLSTSPTKNCGDEVKECSSANCIGTLCPGGGDCKMCPSGGTSTCTSLPADCTNTECAGLGNCPGEGPCAGCSNGDGECGGDKHTCSSPEHCEGTGCNNTVCSTEHCKAETGTGHGQPCDGTGCSTSCDGISCNVSSACGDLCKNSTSGQCDGKGCTGGSGGSDCGGLSCFACDDFCKNASPSCNGIGCNAGCSVTDCECDDKCKSGLLQCNGIAAKCNLCCDITMVPVNYCVGCCFYGFTSCAVGKCTICGGGEPPDLCLCCSGCPG